MSISKKMRRSLMVSSALSAMAPLVVANAQDGEGERDDDVIVVTALKRAESAQDIPATLTATPGAVLEEQGIKDLFQAVTLVPGVVFSRAPDDGLALTFRGLGTAARPQAFEQSVAVFTDGVFLGKGRLYSTALFDAERLEFIKGTQSTLLGKNASLGAVSVVTRQPGDVFSVEARAGYEVEYGGYVVDAGADLPLGERAAVRLAVHYNDYDGWVRNTFTDHDGPEQKDLGFRGTLKFEPTDGFRLSASYQYANNEQIGASYQLVGPIDPAFGEGLLNGETAQFTSRRPDGETFHRTRSHIATLKGELDIGDHTLISQTAYVRYSLFFLDDFDFSIDDTINFQREEEYEQITQELRFQSPTGQTLEYMAGVFYLGSDWDSLESQLWGVPAFPPPPDPASGQLFNGPFFNDYVLDSKAYSVFASATWNVTDAFRISGGVRYTREEKDVVFGRTNAAPFTVWNSIANPPFAPTPLTHDSDFVDGNATIEYDVTDDVMAYASFGHGSKSGGFVETNTIAVPPPLLVGGLVPAPLVEAGAFIEDELTTSYEAGLKTNLFDGRLTLNLAGFWTDIENFQDSVFTGGPLGFITFTGPSRSRGFEADWSARVTSDLTFSGGVTYADATGILQPIDPMTNTPVVDGMGAPVLERFRRPQAPKVVLNVGLNYERPVTNELNGRFTAGLRHRSSMFNQVQELFLSDALTTLDLGAGIETSDGRYGIDVQARNVTNSIAEDFASPSVDPRFGAFFGAYLAGPNQQRTVLISAKVKF